MSWTELETAARGTVRLVAAVFDLEPETFLRPNKGRPEHVHARQVVMYLLRTEGGFDQALIGRALGGRHHSTVWHAVQRVERLRDDEALDAAITALQAMYRELRAASECVPEVLREAA